MPKMQFRSNAKPSVYAYPGPIEEKKGREAEKVETAVLSTTAKAKAKEIKKEKRKATAPTTTVTPTNTSRPATVDEKMELVNAFVTSVCVDVPLFGVRGDSRVHGCRSDMQGGWGSKSPVGHSSRSFL